MKAVLELMELPECGLVELNLNYTFEIKVSAIEARRKVNGWLLDYVSYMMRAQQPSLLIGNGIVWRVPIILTTPDLGAVGELGVVHVDVKTGQMDSSDEYAQMLCQAARKIGERLPPYQPRKTVPPEYLAKHLTPTHWYPSVKQKETTALVGVD